MAHLQVVPLTLKLYGIVKTKKDVMKKLLLLNFYVLASMSTHSALAQNETKELKPAIIDSTDLVNNSTSKKISNQGFTNLFENAELGANSGPYLNPQAISFVKDYINDYGKDLAKMKDWALPYFNMMDAILTENELPTELKYLAVIESRLKSSAVSWAGAVGPWQFMPATAMKFGLRVSRKYDERTDYVKSTKAAAKYLKTLYNIFGDWLLVIAAYNGGAGNVQRAIRKSNSTDFWTLQYYLPAESRNHVKKFIGTHYIFEGQGGLTTLTKTEVEEHYGAKGMYLNNRKISETEMQNCKTLTIAGKYNSSIVAKYINMDLKEFNRYNPSFDKVMASSTNSYDLKLPVEKMDLFTTNKYQILNESVQMMLNSGSAQTKTTSESSETIVRKDDIKRTLK